MKKVAEHFHKNNTILFSTIDLNSRDIKNETQYYCDNTINTTAIFAPSSEKTSEFALLSEMLESQKAQAQAQEEIRRSIEFGNYKVPLDPKRSPAPNSDAKSLDGETKRNSIVS